MEKSLRFILGSLLVAAGGTLIGLSTFNYSSLGVSAGLLVFCLAYLTMWEEGGIEPGSLEELFSGYAKGFTSRRLFFGFTMTAGTLIIGKGLVIGAKATETLAVSGMVACGILVLSGYFITHESFLRGFLG